MSLAFDQFGRPYLIVRDQDKKKRVKGLDAIKLNLNTALSVAYPLRTSFGPKGMDKMIVDPHGQVTITNDGATILQKIEVQNPVAKLMVEMAQSQDEEIGDGTTGVVVLASLLIEEALKLLQKGLHPLKIAKGFDMAVDFCLNHLD